MTIATLCGRNRGQQPLRKRESRIGTVSLIHVTWANSRGHRRPPCPLPGAISAGWDENITHGLCSEWMLRLRRCPGMVSTTLRGPHALLLPAVLIFPMTGLAKEGCAAGHTDATGLLGRGHRCPHFTLLRLWRTMKRDRWPIVALGDKAVLSAVSPIHLCHFQPIVFVATSKDSHQCHCCHSY